MNPFYEKYTEDGQVPKYVYKDTSVGGETIRNPPGISVREAIARVT